MNGSPIPAEDSKLVLVKFRGKPEMTNWVIGFITEVQQTLDHRMIEQKEFLDAILGNDASVLCRALEEEDEGAEEFLEASRSSAQSGRQGESHPSAYVTCSEYVLPLSYLKIGGEAGVGKRSGVRRAKFKLREA